MSNILEIVNNFYKYTLPLFNLIEERIEGETEEIYKEIGKKIYEAEINNLLHTDEINQKKLYKELKQLLYLLRMIEKAINSLNENIIKENKLNFKVYLDMDGVVADFERRFTELAGMAPKEFENKYGKNAFWDFIDEGDNKIKFWVGIPPMPGAKELVSHIVANFDYEMLTAPSLKKQSLIGKTAWIKKWTKEGLFPSKPKINFKAAKNKHKVKDKLTKFDILIDDKASTIDNWNEVGGTGILYLNAEQVIKDLENVKKGI